METYDSFLSEFLEGPNLQHVMAYLCRTSSGLVTDPITDVVCVMITNPIHMVITEIGIAPFKDKLTYVYPYVEMTAGQQEFVQKVVADHRDGAKKCVSSSLQMGGGCIIEVGRGKSPVYLQAENVLSCLCELVFKSIEQKDSWQRCSICNILLQRISGSINVPRAILQKVGGSIERMELQKEMLREEEEEEEEEKGAD